jgi:hypothetical protein
MPEVPPGPGEAVAEAGAAPFADYAAEAGGRPYAAGSSRW